MKRRALIISNPGEVGGENFCKGVLVDVLQYKAFFKSPYGGLWHDDEVVEICRPSQNEFITAVSSLSLVDYACIVFTGHGYFDVRKQETILELRQGQEIGANVLGLGARRQTAILDCCRKPHAKKAIVEGVEKIALKAPFIDEAKCRETFDTAVLGCSTGRLAMYACSIGETAGDDSLRGGVYSSNLLTCAKDWADAPDPNRARGPRVLSAAQVHDLAELAVRYATAGE